MSMSKKLATGVLLGMTALAGSALAADNSNSETAIPKEGKAMKLEQNWDKTFPQSNKVNHSKVTFTNRYGIRLVADMYIPKNASGRLPAIAVWAVWSRQGTGCRTLCTDYGGAWFPDDSF